MMFSMHNGVVDVEQNIYILTASTCLPFMNDNYAVNAITILLLGWLTKKKTLDWHKWLTVNVCVCVCFYVKICVMRAMAHIIW